MYIYMDRDWMLRPFTPKEEVAEGERKDNIMDTVTRLFESQLSAPWGKLGWEDLCHSFDLATAEFQKQGENPIEATDSSWRAIDYLMNLRWRELGNRAGEVFNYTSRLEGNIVLIEKELNLSRSWTTAQKKAQDKFMKDFGPRPRRPEGKKLGYRIFHLGTPGD